MGEGEEHWAAAALPPVVVAGTSEESPPADQDTTSSAAVAGHIVRAVHHSLLESAAHSHKPDTGHNRTHTAGSSS